MSTRLKLSFKGIIIGAIVNVVGTNAWGLVTGIYLTAKYHLYALPQAERTSQLYALLTNDTKVRILAMIVGGAFTILGGYIAARIAKHDELLNGTVSSFLCIFFALTAIGWAPIVDVLFGAIGDPILGFVGGLLRLKQGRSNHSLEASSLP